MELQDRMLSKVGGIDDNQRLFRLLALAKSLREWTAGKDASVLEQFLNVVPNGELFPGLEPADGVEEASSAVALLEEAFQASQRFRSGQPQPGQPSPLCKVGKFWVGRMLNQGGMGKVWVGTSADNQAPLVALKTVAASLDVTEELRIHQRCDHANIIRLHEVVYLPSVVAIAMEYAAQGDMLAYLKSRIRLSEDETRPLFAQLAQGVKYLHENLITHCDLKLENLLLDAVDGLPLRVKIADFGVAFDTPVQHAAAGTPSYMAPELIAGRPYGRPVDVWAMGVIFYALLRGSLPFKGTKAITSDTVQIQGSVDAVDLVRGLFVQDPERRLKIDAVLQHGFLTSATHRPPDGPAQPTSGMGQMGSQIASFGGFSAAAPQRGSVHPATPQRGLGTPSRVNPAAPQRGSPSGVYRPSRRVA